MCVILVLKSERKVCLIFSKGTFWLKVCLIFSKGTFWLSRNPCLGGIQKRKKVHVVGANSIPLQSTPFPNTACKVKGDFDNVKI